MYQEYKNFFNENGFVVIPDVITSEKIADLRQAYKEALEKYQLVTLTPTQFLEEIDIAKVIFESKVVEATREIVGPDYHMYPDFTIRENLYIPWHTDVSYLPADVANDGGTANFVQCSIYLQDNNQETGGGLEVLSGSHLSRGIDRRNPTNTEGLSFENPELTRSTAGALVFWDSRIVHRSIKNKVPENSKLAIQWTVSANDNYSELYLDYLRQRAEKTRAHVSDQGKREEAFVNDIANIQFPGSFSSDLLGLISQQNLRFQLM